MSTPVLDLLAGAVNRALALDPEAAAVLAPLDGARIRITVRGAPGADAVVSVDGARVSLEAYDVDLAQPVDVALAGPVPALLGLARGSSTMPASAGVSVSGDVARLEHLRRALARLRPDWEEPLARVLGDELAHPVARGLRALAAGGLRLARSLEADVAEYLREESDWLVRREAVEDFAAGVDSARDAVERLEKRIEALERRR